jgi:trimethylamine--corrinoid protein Co-methyltransferase
MVLSLEQLLIDVEVFRMCRQARRGVVAGEDKWLEDVINCVGPGGNFLSERSTVDGIRGGEWTVSKLGVHEPFESWEAAGRPSLLEQARDEVDQILAAHQLLPLEEDVERELDRIQKRARARAEN